MCFCVRVCVCVCVCVCAPVNSNINDRQKKESPTSVEKTQPPSKPTIISPSNDQPKAVASDVKRTPFESSTVSGLVRSNVFIRVFYFRATAKAHVIKIINLNIIRNYKINNSLLHELFRLFGYLIGFVLRRQHHAVSG